jgi:spermidine synthase
VIDERLARKPNVAYEEHDPSYGAVFLYEQKLASVRSRYQKIEVFQTKEHGRILLIDDFMMLTEDSEFVYHEMMVHVPLAVHKTAKEVLVIGGGDGGTVRELLKYPRLKKITLVEIDEEVIRVCREYFPHLAGSLSDPRVEVIIGDGAEYVKNLRGSVDVVIIDSTDPFGPAELLVSQSFYRDCRRALGTRGLLMQQMASPFFTPDVFVKAFYHMRQVFPAVHPILVPTPFYVSSDWSLGLASESDTDWTSAISPSSWESISYLKYYNLDVHRESFALPNFVRRLWDLCLTSPVLPPDYRR